MDYIIRSTPISSPITVTRNQANYFIAQHGIYVYDDYKRKFQWRHGDHDLLKVFGRAKQATPPRWVQKQVVQERNNVAA